MIPTLQLGQFGRRVQSVAAGGGAGPPDPYFANVSSLCHYAGTNNSTTVTDQIAGTTWTLVGNTKISTTQSLFGGTSLFMDDNDTITSNSDSRFTMGTGDFTWEFSVWIDPATFTSVQSNLLEITSGTSLAIYYSSNLTLRLFANGSDRITGGPLVTNAWNRVAISRVSGTTRLFLGGTSLGTYADANNYSGTAIRMNVGNVGAGVAQNHYFDELRITKGVGRYSSNYTPDTTPFGDSA